MCPGSPTMMPDPMSRELIAGKSPREMSLSWSDGLTTWSQVWPVAADEGGFPLLVLHGGPGMPHDYLRNLRHLGQDRREVIFYDQVGNGRSSRHRARAGDAGFWTIDLFLRELEQVVNAYDLLERGYHLLGHSWGGMLGIEWAIGRPQGLKSLILANAPSSMLTWSRELTRLRRLLPEEFQAVLHRHEQAGTTNSEEYGEATLEFYRHHLCRLEPWPADMREAYRKSLEDTTVYATMIGPSEFHVTGSLATWDRDNQLHQIEVPALVLHGDQDEATDAVVEASKTRIRDVVYSKVADSSHTPHLEKPDFTFGVVGDFLTGVEGRLHEHA